MKEMGKIGKSAGFTLIEMLTVIGVIAILAAILMPALSSARQSAREAAAFGDIKNIELAMEMYANDFYSYPSDDIGELKERENDIHYSIEDFDNRKDAVGAALVFALSEDLEISDKDVGPYMEFKAERLESKGDYYVYKNPFGNAYYRFRNNPDSGVLSREATWNVNDWDVCCVNRSGVDIWTADHEGRDFVDRGPGEITEVHMPPTWESLRDEEVEDIKGSYHSITNW